MFRLHGFSQSGNTFKVAFALRAMGLPHEMVFVDFMNGITRDPAWRQSANAMGEVPVLEDGTRQLTQSGAILGHLSRLTGQFGGQGEDEQMEVQRWLFFDNHKFTSYFASYRFAKAFGPSAPDPAVMAWLRGRIEAAYGIVDKHLSAREFMVGNAPTIADLSLCGYLFYPAEESGIDVRAQFPAIAAWLARLQGTPGWAHPYDCLPGERIAPRW
jgi:glutathione S-transferase